LQEGGRRGKKYYLHDTFVSLKKALSSREFKDFLGCHNLFYTDEIQFRYLNLSSPSIGFVVQRKYGDAVHRNLLKRRCRDLFLKLVKSGFSLSLVVRPRRNKLTIKEISDSFQKLSKEIPY